MKYLDQIRAMLTVPFIQAKSAFASLTVHSGTEKTVCGNIVIYGQNNQTISNTNLFIE